MRRGAIAVSMSAIPIGPPQYAETYPATNRSVPIIRRQVELVLKIWSMEALHDEVSAVVSELAGNAVQHCEGGTFDVSVLRVDRGVRVSVTDSCARKPVMRPVSLSDECGRGMLIIDTLASQWGVKELPNGKTVWADVLLSPPVP